MSDMDDEQQEEIIEEWEREQFEWECEQLKDMEREPKQDKEEMKCEQQELEERYYSSALLV